jgi:hypothetical protein
MGKRFFILFLACISLACKNEIIEKPKKLIDQKTMVNILYDLTILDALKANQSTILTENDIDPNQYIYQKYNIDSLQFVENNKYYAADVKIYKKMYETIEKRLEVETVLNDSLIHKSKQPSSINNQSRKKSKIIKTKIVD